MSSVSGSASISRGWLAALVVFAGGVAFGVPSAAADPQAGSESAQATIDDLTAEGYNVEINWVSGRSSVPLSDCSVGAIHNPTSSPPAPGTFTTVYVDVKCPNEPGYSGSILGSLGVG